MSDIGEMRVRESHRGEMGVREKNSQRKNKSEREKKTEEKRGLIEKTKGEDKVGSGFCHANLQAK